MKISLAKAIPYKDNKISEIDFDFDSLTGNDILNVEKELRASGENIAAWDYSRTFIIAIAAKSCHLPVEVLKNSSLSDFTKIINETLSFLNGAA